MANPSQAQTQPWIRNLWYLAAWTDEVPEGGWLARELLGAPWLLWQASDGTWVAMADRCPHRFVPLSRGRRVGDAVHCGYHGLGFARDGACVFSPFGAAPAASVRTLPLVERHGGLWVWPGEGEPDPALIPDFAFVTDGAPTVRAHLMMDADYELIADNLMDLSHAEFLHVETFGVNGSLFAGQQTVETDASGAIWNKWDMVDAAAPDWAAPMLPPGTRIDQTLHMRWHAPAAMALFITLNRRDTGAPLVPPMANPHIITPARPGHSHYFYTRDPGEDAAVMAQRVLVDEDEPMIRAAAQGLGGEDFWAARPLILPTDAAAIRARRRLQQLRRREAGEAE